MTSKPIAVLALATLLVLAVPAGVVMTSIPLQTAQAQPLGSDIVGDVLDSVFDDDGDDDENGSEEEEDDNGNEATQEGDDNQNIDQTADQTNEQEQEVDQENDQSETNIQANELDTGNNTAAVTQVNDGAQEVAAASESESEESEAESEDGSGDNYLGKKKKHHDSDHHYSGSSSDSDSTSADAESIANAAAEATGIQDQNNTADVDQNSSANDNILVTENTFGDDENTQVAVPIVDQEQTADQAAANLDIEILREQTPTPPDDDGVPPPEEEDAFFCLPTQLLCFESLAECQQAVVITQQVGECRGFETLPEGANICTVEGGRIRCELRPV